ncbi:MAG: CBS domain-containing protein [Gemmatimonadales bacterium]|nr:MAG: CBS domain-containing protein [Gemmatimonadales bacterium]
MTPNPTPSPPPAEGLPEELRPEAIRAFTRAILRDLQALERILDQGLITEGQRHVGAEQELFLVGPGWRPAPLGQEVLARLGDGPFTPELALFNLEVNLPPEPLTGNAFSRMEEALEGYLDQVREAAEAEGAKVVLSGTLPTLMKSDLTLEQITPEPRYRALNEALTRMRGGEYHLRIEGIDELIVRHDSVMLEACNTSCQVHLQVSPSEFATMYNVAQLVAGPVLAVAVNSPLLFGRRLWAETRIALFQQSLDTRSATPYVRDMAPRVRFGDDWVRESMVELFTTDLSRFRVLLAGPVPEDPLEKLARGEMPGLEALQMYNSTLYRWNRPCLGVKDGVAHLRIESRALPAGPSVADQVANAAFWIGLVLGIAREHGNPSGAFPFEEAKSNFMAAARDGLRAGLRWLDGEVWSASRLILDRLLPLARAGLEEAGISREDRDRTLGIIEARVRTGRTGSDWILASLAEMGESGTRSERLAALTAASEARQRSRKPVHEWELATIGEAGGWTHTYLRVEQYMNTRPVTVNEDELVDLVAFVMDRQGIRHIPVEDHEQRLVGLVSYRSLLRSLAERGGEGLDGPIPVREVMEPRPVTVRPETPTLEAIQLMRARGVACLPVVQDERLVGLVTERDFMPIAYELLEERLRE